MISAVIGRQSTTPDGVVNRINGMLGKMMQSPRDDLRGEYKICEVSQVQVIQIAPSEWYGIAVVLMGIDKETLNVEEAFFNAAAEKSETNL